MDVISYYDKKTLYLYKLTYSVSSICLKCQICVRKSFYMFDVIFDFLSGFEELMGADFIQFYRKECHQQVLMTEFETAKKRVKADGEATINIPLSWAIDGQYR